MPVHASRLLGSFAIILLFITNLVLAQADLENRSETRTPKVDALQVDWNGLGQIDWDVAGLLGLMSKTAYEDDTELMQYLSQGLGFYDCRFVTKHSSAVHLLIADDVLVVAFRGTEFKSLADWKSDLKSGFIDNPGVGRLHKGFNKAYEYVRADVEAAIREHNPKTLWLTGHSLGGALATICGMRIVQNGYTPPYIVTFGQPRVGDNATAQWLDRKFATRYQRFANDNDIVPRLPPQIWPFRYADAGRYIHLGRERMMTARSPASANLEMSDNGNSLLDVAPVDSSPRRVLPALQGGRRFEPADNSIYQSSAALLPLTDQEFEKLVAEETRMLRGSKPTNLYFPSAETNHSPVSIATTPNGPQAFGGWFSRERITDHYMDNYLALIRQQRDEPSTN